MFYRPSDCQMHLDTYRERTRYILDTFIRQHIMKSHTLRPTTLYSAISTIDDLEDNKTTLSSLNTTNQSESSNTNNKNNNNNNRRDLFANSNVRINNSAIEMRNEKSPLLGIGLKRTLSGSVHSSSTYGSN